VLLLAWHLGACSLFIGGAGRPVWNWNGRWIGCDDDYSFTSMLTWIIIAMWKYVHVPQGMHLTRVYLVA
jgi:hypothetical protein